MPNDNPPSIIESDIFINDKQKNDDVSIKSNETVANDDGALIINNEDNKSLQRLDNFDGQVLSQKKTVDCEKIVSQASVNGKKSEVVEDILHDLEKTLNESEKISDNLEKNEDNNCTEKMEKSVENKINEITILNKKNSQDDDNNSTCELNKNFTCEITNDEIDIVQLNSENSRNALFENNTPSNKDNLSFVMHDDGSRNFELGMELTPFTLNDADADCDELASQEMMVKAGA